MAERAKIDRNAQCVEEFTLEDTLERKRRVAPVKVEYSEGDEPIGGPVFQTDFGRSATIKSSFDFSVNRMNFTVASTPDSESGTETPYSVNRRMKEHDEQVKQVKELPAVPGQDFHDSDSD